LSKMEIAVTVSSPAVVTVAASTVPPSSAPAPSVPASTGPWRLVFDASADHSTLTRYVLDISSTLTRALVLTRDIGKPARAADGTCTVDVDTLVTGLPPGSYDGVVRAVGPTGSSASYAYTFNR